MTNWTATFIPVGSLLLGSVLAMCGQALSDRRTSGRDRESRLADLRIRQYEIERETLLALQNAVAQHVKIAAEAFKTAKDHRPAFDNTELPINEMEIRLLAARTL